MDQHQPDASGTAMEVATEPEAVAQVSPVPIDGHGESDGGMEDDWTDRFTLLWMEVRSVCDEVGAALEKAQRGEESVEKVRDRHGQMDKLLRSAESIIRAKLLDTSSHEAAPVKSVMATANPRNEAEPASVNSLDSYLNAGPSSDEVPLPQDFVDSVRGWEVDGLPQVAPVAPVAPPPKVIDGLELHELLMRNRRKCQVPAHAHENGGVFGNVGPHDPGLKRKRRSPSANTHAGWDSVLQTASARISKRMLSEMTAQRVLDKRSSSGDRSPVEYLIKFSEREEPLWLRRKQCPIEVRDVIDAYISKVRVRNRIKCDQAGDNDGDSARSSRRESDSDDLTKESGTYIVDTIVDHRMRYGRKQYYVKWEGYDCSENTWESAAKLKSDVPELVEAYERSRARSIGPPNSRNRVTTASAARDDDHDASDSANADDDEPREVNYLPAKKVPCVSNRAQSSQSSSMSSGSVSSDEMANGDDIP